MLISDILTPKQDVLENNIRGALQVHKVEDKEESRIESNPEKFLEVTYPSDKLLKLLESVNDKLIGKTDQGGHILSGSYGSGKTHGLITLYHLFENPEIGKNWLEEWDINVNVPMDSESVIVGTQTEDVKYLWEPVFRKMGREDLLEKVNKYPEIPVIEELAENKTIAIFFDEIESWYQTFDKNKEEHIISRNEMFLQNLLEVSKDPNRKVFTFITKLEKGTHLDSVFYRTKPGSVDVSASGDKKKIIFHRMFREERKEINKQNIERIVNNYLENYKDPINIEDKEEYRRKMINSYPFHPQLLEVTENIYDIEKAQNVRGQIDALATLVRENYKEKDLLLLSDLVPEDLNPLSIKLVKGCEQDIENTKDINYSEEILKTILTYSLSERTGVASKSDILLGTLTPEVGKDNILLNLHDVSKKAVFLHEVEGGYVIKKSVNVSSLIRKRKNEADPDEIEEEIAKFTRKAFKGDIKIKGVDEIEDNSDIKYVVFLESMESNLIPIKDFLSDFSYQNCIIPIIPNNSSGPLRDPDIRDKTKELISAKKLVNEFGNDRRDKKRKAKNIINKYQPKVIDKIKEKYGKSVKWMKNNDEIVPRLENVGIETNSVRSKLEPGMEYIEEKILESVKDVEDGKIVDDLLEDFRKVRKYPVIFDSKDFYTAVKNLCEREEVYISDDRTAMKYYGDSKSQIRLENDDVIVHEQYRPRYIDVDGEIEAIRPKIGDKITYKIFVENQKDHSEEIKVNLYHDDQKVKTLEKEVDTSTEDCLEYKHQINESGEHSTRIEYEDQVIEESFEVDKPIQPPKKMKIEGCTISPSNIVEGQSIKYKGRIVNEKNSEAKVEINLFLDQKKVDQLKRVVRSNSEDKFSRDYIIEDEGSYVASMEDGDGQRLARNNISVEPSYNDEKIKEKGNSPLVIANSMESSISDRDQIRSLFVDFKFEDPKEFDKDALLDLISSLDKDNELPEWGEISVLLEVRRRENR